MDNHEIKVAEMFAGVGGFHLGLHLASDKFNIVWADQYEPDRRNQFAFNIYKKNFPNTYAVNQDITKIDKLKIPDMDLLVGGFPCQDYSVASSTARGLYGKKGVLWWDIKDVIEAKWPKFVFLENVDRLLTSPGVNKSQTGRDFGMILRTLSDLGYCVTWKVINAADYGFPQRRRRTFIFAARDDTDKFAELKNVASLDNSKIEESLENMAPLSTTLGIDYLKEMQKVNLREPQSLLDFSNEFKLKKGFRKTGFMIEGEVFMADYEPVKSETTNLSTIIKPNLSDESLYLTPEKKEKFIKMKKGFQTIKQSRTGYPYKYGMGSMAFPDPLDRPARTMVTSEHTVSRMTHVVRDPGNQRLRVISPEEAELINTFPEMWTKLDGVSNSERYFTMGNALVVNLIRDIGKEIEKIFEVENIETEYRSSKKVENVMH